MRVGAFLLGGLAGAAAVVYFRRNYSLPFDVFSRHDDDHERKQKRWGRSSFSSSSRKREDDESKEYGFDQLETLIKKDPAVKSQIDEILHKSEGNFMTQ